jgi:tRNA-dihydrouridine synthase
VYYDGSGTYLREDGAAEYCGVELIAIDGRTIDLGSLGSAKWECN